MNRVIDDMKQFAGWLVLASLLLYLGGLTFPPLHILGAVISWLVVILQWRGFSKSMKNQAGILFGAGIAILLFSYSQGVTTSLDKIFMVNYPLLAMFAAVAFLALTTPSQPDMNLPTSKSAALTTALGTNLLGAVINLSILFVFGDRMQREGSLTRNQRIILARSFCAAAWWSPFFIALGVALTYAPEAQWHHTFKPGFLMSIIAILYTTIEVALRSKEQFRGYPIRVESLVVVVSLAAAVMLLHYLFPTMRILNLICCVSPIGAMIFMKGSPKNTVLKNFVETKILSVSPQFILFLAAGVFSTAISSLTRVYPTLFNFDGMTFGPMMFASISGILIIIGFLGVHPIVGISIISPLILPLNPDHSQLAFMYLTSWAVATGSSPLSGVGLVMVSRYNATPLTVLKNNYHYAIAMWAISSVLNYFYFR